MSENHNRVTGLGVYKNGKLIYETSVPTGIVATPGY